MTWVGNVADHVTDTVANTSNNVGNVSVNVAYHCPDARSASSQSLLTQTVRVAYLVQPCAPPSAGLAGRTLRVNSGFP